MILLTGANEIEPKITELYKAKNVKILEYPANLIDEFPGNIAITSSKISQPWKRAP